MKTLLVFCTAVLLFGGSAKADATKVKVGDATSINTSTCTTKQDMDDIVTYANTHNGDGFTAYKEKQAAGLCGNFTSSQFGPIIIKEIGVTYHDKDLGDRSVITFTLENDPSVTLWGIITTDALDQASI